MLTVIINFAYIYKSLIDMLFVIQILYYNLYFELYLPIYNKNIIYKEIFFLHPGENEFLDLPLAPISF
jgi:hypothetical protein